MPRGYGHGGYGRGRGGFDFGGFGAPFIGGFAGSLLGSALFPGYGYGFGGYGRYPYYPPYSYGYPPYGYPPYGYYGY